ncbi:hypothetical protein BBO99_00003408 [Phytophthora kernoviae]|uniref:Uncharacterized protein n=2 Tax=Phytophthora kernoviae TaxID=325452 RepID=A0A3R7J573_9STRA|nr:hypothetical protein G195_003786 [Phytophthora kernoviae 00238/432]KAG2531913.1 hypothetical protein JM16_000575 [Phytophthora kernoviae]KAG2532292.1 hypothetical protein JM18_000716 [Phytophthora kernoviae]RLN25795.1 hypothetical protein BBI17_003047 [Phytophthora kernoviae]RLN81795.1 hypothetical protein BBO99_00003408 [Phytophthora kernoviae]
MAMTWFGLHLEDDVLRGLVPVVAAIVGTLLASDLYLLRSKDQVTLKQFAHGILGLLQGTAVFHVTIVLFGAPVVELWMQTLLLAVLISSCTTMPLAIYLGCAPRKWLDLLLELRVGDTQELYLTCSTIGAMLGAYIGALPIPLDWDRPWQQWPLTCLYGTLFGHAVGILVRFVIGTTTSFAAKSTKKD